MSDGIPDPRGQCVACYQRHLAAWLLGVPRPARCTHGAPGPIPRPARRRTT